MATVNLQNNPDTAIAGSRDADAVIITSEISAVNNLVNYQIENITTAVVININSDGTETEGGNVVDVNKIALKIILEFRTKYRVRTKHQFGNWGSWVNFTTRDKQYQSPEAITQLTDDTDATAQTQGFKTPPSGPLIAQGGSRTIVVTNNSKATETDDSAVGYNVARNWGNTTVINTDTIFGDGQLQRTGTVTIQDGSQVSVLAPVQFTARGATVVNVPEGINAPIKFTNRGATVNTIRS